ncbi:MULTISPECIES: DUF1934 family protein [unclassified Gemella]|uniref:DUF1934 family protein n=1 Tax=unclassified Gemella TaxID=2624949 RepID=UPI001C046680|nr:MULTISPECIES: DUF1934 family protein [unclassified Gemella]MBU0278450.1 DUF1934 domain-containing protein [Gemella sp. zg-1178]QWQ38938.1 DUF1934 domain-containing protein [Gemella sp. zg-570]
MKINITTYIDNEKLLFEKNMGDLVENEKNYILTYQDSKKNNFEIKIAKDASRADIIKDGVVLALSKKLQKTNYKTDFGIVSFNTHLQKINILEKNKFIQFEIDYKIYFSDTDKQDNKLKILVNRN